jgi:hypothetical protein
VVGRCLAALTAPVLPAVLRQALGFAPPVPDGPADRVAALSRRVADATPGPLRRTPLRIALGLWARPPQLPALPVRPRLAAAT